MEVHLTNPELERKLTELAASSGRKTDDLVQDALAGYLEELTELRSTLDERYDDLKNGRLEAVSGDEVGAHFRDKSAAARRGPQPA